MAIKLNELEATGTRWQAPTQDYPQGSFINGTGQGKRDGSYAKAEWANDIFGFHGAILKNGDESPNGQVETAENSQVFNALKKIIKNDIDTLGGDPSAVASGDVNNITATFTKPVSFEGGKLVKVRAIGVNTSETVTFNPNGLGAKLIVKGDNDNLSIGDIAGEGFWITLIYDATLDKWVLQNPATGVTLVLPKASTSTKGIIQIATQSEVTNGTDSTKAVTSAYLKVELDKKATKEEVNLKAPLNNPTFTGSVIVPSPTQNSHAATKQYVDSKISSPKAYITATGKSGNSWYRSWSDGFKEIGFVYSANMLNGNDQTVSLPWSMPSSNYHISYTPLTDSWGNGNFIEQCFYLKSKSTTNFTFQQAWIAKTGLNFYICGY